MIQLHLEDDEAAILKEMLEIRLSDLRDEIHATDNPAYKEMLKKRREIVLKLMDEVNRELAMR